MRKSVLFFVVLAMVVMCIPSNAEPKKEANGPSKERQKYEKLIKDSDLIIEGRVLRIHEDLTPSETPKIPYWAEIDVVKVYKGSELLKKVIIGFPDRVVIPASGKVPEMKNLNSFQVQDPKGATQLLFLKKDAKDQLYWAKTPDRRLALKKGDNIDEFFDRLEALSDTITFLCPKPRKDYIYPMAVIETNFGDLVFKLDFLNAKQTTLNFINLSKSGFYDGISFHRNAPGFILQGGKPKGMGFGGPGYMLKSDNNPNQSMKLGALAMAEVRDNTKKAGTIGAGADTINGSQFFISCATFSPYLINRHYPVFGQIMPESLPALYHINNMQIDDKYAPVNQIVIKSVKIFEDAEWQKEKVRRQENIANRKKEIMAKLKDESIRPVAVFETDKGRFEFKFYNNVAPETTARIISLITDGWYTGQQFYYVRNGSRPYAETGNPLKGKPGVSMPNIRAEFTKKIKFDKGIVGLSRKKNSPDSGTCSIFFSMGRAESWDNNYTAFGKIIGPIKALEDIIAVETTGPQGAAKPEIPAKPTKLAPYMPYTPIYINKSGIEWRDSSSVETDEYDKLPSRDRKEVPQMTDKKDNKKPIAVIETNLGTIEFEFYKEDAPNTCQNFIKLADKGFYNSLIFHRVIKDFMIQGGCPLGTGTGDPGYKIDAEFNNRKHLEGTVAMARAADPNSAGSQFYICLKSQPGLDNKYTIFGQVIKGLEIVQKIGAVETDARDKPKEDVIMKKVYIDWR